MKWVTSLAIAIAVLTYPLASGAQQAKSDESAKASDPAKKTSGAAKKDDSELPRPVEVTKEAQVGGSLIRYRVTSGLMPIRNASGTLEAKMFYIAYTRLNGGDAAKRPLTFSFNGGPGSCSVWLHLGALGPRRIKLPSDNAFPQPPFELVDNEYSWLDLTDLVFIDPVGTGYSRPVDAETGKKFYSMRGDVESVGEFIRMYLTRHERWGSPLFLAGESYGTTRAAGLSDYLVERGVAFNGFMLISSALNFQTISFDPNNDLPYILYLPGYAATAWYHKKLSDDFQRDLQKTLKDAEHFAEHDYAVALAQGDRLTGDERKAVVDKLAQLTGLEASFIDQANLRIGLRDFTRELLKKERRIVGRLDSRYQGAYGRSVVNSPTFDPSLAAMMPPFTTMINQYLRRDLDYESDETYHILGTGIGPWDFGTAGEGYPDTTVPLRAALAKSPHTKVFVASGFFDLATPYTATRYIIDHLGLDPKLAKNIHIEEYEAGHMMYVHEPSLARLKKDVAKFIEEADGR